MGLFDFIGNALGTKDTFTVQPMTLDHSNYNGAISSGQNAALESLNSGQGTGMQQSALAQQLLNQSNGQGPSLAQMQLQQASDQNMKNNAALIASTRGINPAQAARQIAMSNSSQGQNLANQAAQLRLNEQNQKQQLLANSLNAQRTQDIAGQGANNQFYGMAGNLQNAQNSTGLQNYYGSANITAGTASQNAAQNAAMAGGLIQGATGLGANQAAASKASGAATGAASGGGAGAAGAGGGGDAMMVAAASTGGRVENGNMKVAVSPGEKIVGPDGDMKTVPGKAPFAGDDPRNDIVIADLREGTDIVPRSKSTDKENIIDFLKHMKQSGEKKNDLQSFLDSHEEMKQKLEEINYKLGKMRMK